MNGIFLLMWGLLKFVFGRDSKYLYREYERFDKFSLIDDLESEEETE